MEKFNLIEQLTPYGSKNNEIRKFGAKEKENDFSSKKFLFLMILSIGFLFVIMWLLFLLSEKNKKINDLNINIIKLETKTECLENMAKIYEEKFQIMMENIVENNKSIKEELSRLKDEISRKCNTPSPIIRVDEPKRSCIIF